MVIETVLFCYFRWTESGHSTDVECCTDHSTARRNWCPQSNSPAVTTANEAAATGYHPADHPYLPTNNHCDSNTESTTTTDGDQSCW